MIVNEFDQPQTIICDTKINRKLHNLSNEHFKIHQGTSEFVDAVVINLLLSLPIHVCLFLMFFSEQNGIFS